MKDFAQQAAKIKKIIKKSHHILLHLHPGPDGDSISSALAMFYALKQLKKRTTIISGDSPMPQFLCHLPGFDIIQPQNYFQTDLSSVDLFIVLDSADLIQISKLKLVSFPPDLKTINIDHHASNTKYADINLVDPHAAATCQILFTLFHQWGIKITKNIATCLLTGIYSDSQFKYDYTTWQTFDIAAQLARIYPKFTQLFSQVDNSNNPKTLKLAGLLLSSVKTYFNDQVALASISYKTLKKYHLSSADSKGLDVPNLLKSVIGWDIDLALYEIQPGQTKISFRTRRPDKYDLSKIAQALGGGGHRAAAGAIIKKPLPQAKKLLIATISSLHPHLGNP